MYVHGRGCVCEGGEGGHSAPNASECMQWSWQGCSARSLKKVRIFPVSLVSRVLCYCVASDPNKTLTTTHRDRFPLDCARRRICQWVAPEG
jgi:hypothetical protein